MDLIHTIYCSTATDPNFSHQDVLDLLVKARKKNESLGITGILLFHSGAFFQVLEGDREAVEDLYRIIEEDPRHRDVTRLLLEPIAERDFAEWSMGYPQVSEEQMAQVPGINDFFTEGVSLAQMNDGRAKTLLRAFKGFKSGDQW
jgi:hypothetical protein